MNSLPRATPEQIIEFLEWFRTRPEACAEYIQFDKRGVRIDIYVEYAELDAYAKGRE